MALDIRAYEPRDCDAVVRIWTETRWIDDTDEQQAALKLFLEGADAEVGLMEGEAECLVHRTPGTIHYDRTDLPADVVTAVTTSQVGRKQGFASTMTARAVRHGAEAGAAVSLLGMFEQGFYNRLGFGTASPILEVTIDPQSLLVGHIPYRAPVRLTLDDADDMQAALAGRLRHHGAITVDHPDLIRCEWAFAEKLFGLGYRDEGGRLTHFVVGQLKEENGPYQVRFLAYERGDQLLEILRLLRELGDQVHSVSIVEPAELQLHPLIENPNRQRNRTRRSALESGTRAVTWWQLRLLDLDAAAGARRWSGPEVSFNLDLTDPVERYLDPADGWSGLSGVYTVTVGDPSRVAPGPTGGLPTLACDVGALTRMWFGIRPASSLRLTDRFDAPDELCAALDDAFRLPPTLPGMFF